MPEYTLNIGGKEHTLNSEQPLSDADLSGYADSVGAPTPAAPKEPKSNDSQPSAPAPKAQRTMWDSIKPTNDPVEGARRKSLVDNTLGDVGRGFWRSAANAVGSMGQMIEKPLHDIAGVGPGNISTQLTHKLLEKIGPVTSPVAGAVGEAASYLLPGKALGALAGAAPVLTPAAGAAGALPAAGRAAAAMGAGAVGGALSSPVPENESYLAGKAKQAAIGGVVGGGVNVVGQLGGKVVDTAKSVAFGTPSKPQRELWDRAKEMGFSIRPSQARQDFSRTLQAGFGEAESLGNQRIANRIASDKAGSSTGSLDTKFFAERHKTLGAAFDDIYKPGTAIKIDASSVTDLKDFIKYQEHVGYPWANRNSQSAANRIVAEYENLGAGGQAKNLKMKVAAQDIQLLRNELTSAAANAERFDKHSLGQVIESIDDSVARNHPALAAKLADVRPKYRTLVTLENARSRGIVDAQGNLSPSGLGNMLAKSDNKYISGESGHPLQELGQVGEIFGIRGVGQSRTTAGKGLGSGGASDSVPVTKLELYRTAVEAAKASPGVRGLHDKYMKNPYPRDAGSASTAADVGGRLGMEAGRHTPWRKSNEDSDR